MELKSRLAGTPNPGAILRHFKMYKVLVVDLFEVVKVTHNQAKGFIATFLMFAVGGLYIQHLQLILEELGVAHINLVEQELQFKCEFRGTLGR